MNQEENTPYFIVSLYHSRFKQKKATPGTHEVALRYNDRSNPFSQEARALARHFLRNMPSAIAGEFHSGLSPTHLRIHERAIDTLHPANGHTGTERYLAKSISRCSIPDPADLASLPKMNGMPVPKHDEAFLRQARN